MTKISDYSVKLNEDFGPAPSYRQYLMLFTTGMTIIIWLACCIWTFFAPTSGPDGIPEYVRYVTVGILAAAIVIVIAWSFLYFNTVSYHLNATEVTWKRGVWFHGTGIVPYNRITDISIVQGPLMRIFGISHLKIQTAGGGTAKGTPEIQIEGQEKAEELRALIMEYVRGNKNAGAAVVGVEEKSAAQPDVNALLAEVREIRKLLEKKQ
jgi:membrane protein YdbS with pleckstrin-like domain